MSNFPSEQTDQVTTLIITQQNSQRGEKTPQSHEAGGQVAL